MSSSRRERRGAGHPRPARGYGRRPDIVALSRLTLQLHADALPEIFRPSQSQGLAEGTVQEWLVHPDRIVLVATMQGGFAGYAHAELERQTESAIKPARTALHVHEMAVPSPLRGNGIGRALLDAMREAASSHAADELSRDVHAFNTGPRAMYERGGFEPLRMRMVVAVAGDGKLSAEMRR